MNLPVLVLNQDYQPLSVCNVKKSISLIFLGKAEVLHHAEQVKIRTISREFDYPSVIRLLRYIRMPYYSIVLSRKNILKRDHNRCQYCGTSQDLTLDHVIPKSRGGEDSWENLVTACNRCNHKKGNRTPKEAEMNLAQKPFKPTHITFMQTSIGHISDVWKPYLYM